MYIAQAYKFLHDWWRYFAVGLGIVFIATQVGSIPLLGALMFKIMSDGGDMTALADTSTMMNTLESNLTFFLLLLSFAVGLLALYLIVKYVHKQPWVTLTTSRKKTDWGRIWFGFALIAAFTIVTTLVDYYYLSPESYVLQFDLIPFLILAAIGIIMVPLQTSMEEYFFRGYWMQGIGVNSDHKNFAFVIIYSTISVIILFIASFAFNVSSLLLIGYFVLLLIILILILFTGTLTKLNLNDINSAKFRLFNRKWVPLFITSFLFGILHIANPEVEKIGYIILVYYIGTGFFLGIITLMDEGLELALGFHAGNNLVGALLVTADWTVFQTNSIFKDIAEPTVGFMAIMPVFIIYPILIFIMAKKYKWTNWNEKLFGKVVKPLPESTETLAK